MDSVIIRGICRCCASEGPAKDLVTEYHWMGEQEIYSDMLRDCFDVSLCIPEKDASNSGICEVCITQLRNAHNFKKQVLLTEEMFKSKLGNVPMKNIKFLNEDFKADVKIEVDRDDSSSSDNSLDDADETEFEVPIKTEEIMMEDVLDDKSLLRPKPGPSKVKKAKLQGDPKKGSRDDPMVCQTCGQRFTKLYNKKRHLFTAHGIRATVTTKTLCDHCGKLFFNSEYLASHLARGCPGLKCGFCVKCDLKFDTRSSMFIHMRQEHWGLGRMAKLQCPLCDQNFPNHQGHDRHLHVAHEIGLSYEDLIFDCLQDLVAWKEDMETRNGFIFLKTTSTDGNFYYRCYPKNYIGRPQVTPKKNSCPARIDVQKQAGLYIVCYQSTHVCDQKSGKRKKEKAKIVCPMCFTDLDSYEELNNHLSVTHDVDVNTVHLNFDSYAAFHNWKQGIEKSDAVTFYKRTSNTTSKRGETIKKSYYFCAKSGPLRLDVKNNKSRTGVTCPAKFTLTTQEKSDGHAVVYQSTHVGHDRSVSKLTKTERAELARKITNGDSFKAILQAAHSTADDASKLRHLKRRDLYNVVREFGIDKSVVNYDSEKNTRRKVRVELAEDEYGVCEYDSELTVEDQSGATKGRRKKKKKGANSATPERTEHRVNVTTILQNSNASPFRDKKMRGFSCLYCAKYFQDIRDLRTHTAQQSEKDKLNTMIDYKLAYNPIKVDITDLMCTLCNSPMKDLNELKDHLVAVHKRVINRDIKDTILPFRLHDGNVFVCVICSVVHVSFKNLYHHMSSHYRNYCCNKCGDGYITIAALRKHTKTHDVGNFPCSYCDKTYNSLAKKRNHEKGVHTGGWLRNKCPHCPKIFVSYYDRSEHLVREHDETPVTYPCNACSKVYKKKFELNRHIKHHHLQQKSFMCDTCNAKFYSKRGLVDHVQRHLGGEAFTCDVCGKNFSRLRTLTEHVRSHEDDRRYQCEICKKTFMQKCSLKSHVRLHQDDLDIFKEFDDVKHLIDNRDLTLKQIAAENKQKEEAEKSSAE